MMTKRCTKCGEVKSLTDYYLTSKKRGSKPRSHCKVCTLKQCSEYKENNREKVLNYFYTRYREDEEFREKKKRDVKKYRLENPEIAKEKDKLYRAKNKEKIAERKKAYAQKYKERDRPKYLAHTRARQLKLKNAIPIFLQDCSKEKNDVEKIYRLRQILDKATGIEHHVDHMWPISDGGPHWSGNLQIITAKENLTKGSSVCKVTKKNIKDSLRIARKEYENSSNGHRNRKPNTRTHLGYLC